MFFICHPELDSGYSVGHNIYSFKIYNFRFQIKFGMTGRILPLSSSTPTGDFNTRISKAEGDLTNKPNKMKNIFYFFLAIFSILSMSCNNNEQPKINTQNEYVFSEEEIENIDAEEVNNELFDSTIYSSADITERSWVSYYKNGAIKEKGQHVNFNGCGMFGDTLFF